MGRPTFRFIITVFATAFGGSFQFYSFASLNTPQDIIENWINVTYANRLGGVGLSSTLLTFLWSFTVCAISLGAVAGALLTRSIAESCGRRNGLIANGIANIFGGLFVGIAKGCNSPELLIFGRFILGINVGLSSGLAPLYLTEIAPTKYRGAAGTAHMIFVAFGDWFCLLLGLPSILGSEQLWPLALAFPALPALVLCIILPWCPESPRYTLISLGDRERSKKAIEAFCGSQDAKAAFEGLVKEAAFSNSPRKTRIRDLFRRRELRKPVLITMLIMFSQQFTGAAAVFAFSTQMFQNANLSLETSRIATLACGICYFIFTLPSPFLIEKWGRRPISLGQLIGCDLCLIGLAVLTGVQNAFGYVWASYASIGSLVLYMCIYGFGAPVPWLITSELFVMEYRSAAVSIGTFTAWFSSIFISMLYLPFELAVGPAWSFFPFIICLSISIIGMVALLPETKNKSIEEIVREFSDRTRTMSNLVDTVRSRASSRQTTPERKLLIDERRSLLDDDEVFNASRSPIYGAILEKSDENFSEEGNVTTTD